MKKFMTVLILASIALIYSVFILIKELKIYLCKRNKFKNDIHVQEGIIHKIEKEKKKYTVYVKLPNDKIIKTTIQPKKGPVVRHRIYINRKKT